MLEIKNKTTKSLWILSGLLLLLLISTIVYKYQVGASSTMSNKQDNPCSLRERECTQSLKDGGKVSFSIEPKDIPMLKPLAINVKLDGIQASKIEVDFIQQDDDLSLGYNRPALEKVSDSEFKGRAFLALCANDKMIWEAKVLLHTKQGLKVAIFHFLTFK